MTDKNKQLVSTISDDNTLTLSLKDIDMPEPSADEVVVRMEAMPLNPSDFGVMFSAADMSTATQSGTDDSPVITADVPAKFMPALKTRVNKDTPPVGLVWGVDEINTAKQPIQDRVLTEMQLDKLLGGADV